MGNKQSSSWKIQLLCIKSHDHHFKILVPKYLRMMLLFISHHSMVAGRFGGACMYATLRRLFYWNSMRIYVYRTVSNWVLFSKEPVWHKREPRIMKYFRAEQKIPFFSINILGTIRKTAIKCPTGADPESVRKSDASRTDPDNKRA